MEKFFTAKEAAEILNCNRRTIIVHAKRNQCAEIIYSGNRWIMSEKGLEIIKALVQPKGWPKGKKRKNIDLPLDNKI